MSTEQLLKTPLHALHLELGAAWCRSPATTCRCNTRWA
jgi:hypothetical protein